MSRYEPQSGIRDFIAAQDQMIASVNEVVDSHPKQLIVAWDKGEGIEERMGMLIFATPDFVAAVIQELSAQLFFREPTVDPPPE